MKKILSSSLILAALAVAFTGCLKDKGFDNHTYGINDPDTQPPGVGFPLAGNAKNTIGLDAGVPTNQAINNVVFVSLLSGARPTSDITITLVLNDALRTAYNTANGTNILAMPAAQYNVPLTIKIKAGEDSGSVNLNIPSTVPLNPSNSYGVGLTISSVTGGYTIAKNLKDLFLEITLKNKYDGIYRLTMREDGWQAYGIANQATGVYPVNIYLITAGPNSVSIDAPDGPFGNLQPGFTGPTGGCCVINSATAFGATTPLYTFDVATDRLIAVANTTPDDGRARTLFIEASPPVGWAPAGQANSYIPATRRIYMEYFMTQTGRPNQKFFMQYDFIRAR